MADSVSDGGGSAGAHDDEAGALVERPLELLDGPVLVGQRQVGRREDPALVVERERTGLFFLEGSFFSAFPDFSPFNDFDREEKLF